GWVDRRVRDRRNHMPIDCLFVFFSSRRRHTRSKRDWSSDVCSSDLSGSDQFHAFDGDMAHGIDQIQTYKAGMEEILRQYPGCQAVASVLRNMRTVEDGDWMGIYLTDGKFYERPVHTVHSLEAVGAGDAIAGRLLHCLAHGFSPQKTIDFSITASVLKLMIQHDFNVVNESDILKVMKSHDTNLQR